MMTMEAHAADRAARAIRAAELWRLRKASRADLRSAAAARLHRAANRIERPEPAGAGEQPAVPVELHQAA